MPERIQRRRVRGWRMPAGAVYVGRPTIFGNPWTEQAAAASGLFRPEAVPQVCVDEFRSWLIGKTSPTSEHLGRWHSLTMARRTLLSQLPTLRGRGLACWCPLDRPCHADVLLRFANETPAATLPLLLDPCRRDLVTASWAEVPA